MSTPQTRSKAAAAAKTTKKAPKPPSKANGSQKTQSDVVSDSTVASSGDIQEIKDFLKTKMSGASASQINAMARSIAKQRKEAAAKEKRQTIQDNNAAAMEQDDQEGEDDAEAEAGEDEEDEEDEDTVPSKSTGKGGKKKQLSAPASPSRTKASSTTKRKHLQTSDQEASDTEERTKQPKKKPRTQASRKSARVESPELTVVEDNARIIPNRSPQRAREPEVVITRLPEKPAPKVSKDQQQLSALIGMKAVKVKGSMAKGTVKGGVSDGSDGSENGDEEDGGEDVGTPEPVVFDTTPTKKAGWKGKGKAKQASPVDESEGSGTESYKVSDEDDQLEGSEGNGSDGRDPPTRSGADEMDVKLEGKQKAKTKSQARSKSVKVEDEESRDDTIEVSKELLNEEPLKGFLHRATQEFRVYLAVVNAWPRKYASSMEKKQAPLEVIEQTQKKYPMYQTKQFKAIYDPVWENMGMRAIMSGKVYKVAAQFRQEVKQKAKRVVEKSFLTFNLSDFGSSAEKLRKATEDRVRFLKDKDTFHHGDLQMPDYRVDPSLWVANHRAPFHNVAIAEIIARQWWMGANPEALRPEHKDRFDINKIPLSSNMIALVCSAIVVSLDEAMKGNVTVAFDEKNYAPLHDGFKLSIDELRLSADPKNTTVYNEGCARFCKSMDQTLATHIRVTAGVAPDDNRGAVDEKGRKKVGPTTAVSLISKLWAPTSDDAGPSNFSQSDE